MNALRGHLIILLFVTQIVSDCKFPGIPHGLDVVNIKYLKFNENTTAYYRCKDPHDILLYRYDEMLGIKSHYTRTCVMGKWTGYLPQCGRELYGGQLKLQYVAAKNLTSGEEQIIASEDNMEPKDTPKSLDRYNCLQTSSESSAWSIHLKRFAVGLYVEVEIKLDDNDQHYEEEYEELKEEEQEQEQGYEWLEEEDDDGDEVEDRDGDKEMRNITIGLFTNSHQKCHLVSQKSAPIYETSSNRGILSSFFSANYPNGTKSGAYFVRIFGFQCQTLWDDTENNTDKKLQAYLTRTFRVEVGPIEKTSFALCDLRVYNPEAFKCGLAPVPLNGRLAVHSLLRNFSQGSADPVLQTRISYICDEGFKLADIGTEYRFNGGILCGPDGQWMAHTFPTCKPQIICPVLNPANDRMAIDLKRYTFWNQSLVSSNGTTAHFSCRTNGSNQGTLVLNGRQKLVCTPLGHWDSAEPQCLYPEEVSESPSKPLSLFSVIIYSLVCALLGLTVVAAIVYQSCLRSRFRAEKQRQKRIKRRREKRKRRRLRQLSQANALQEEDNYYAINSEINSNCEYIYPNAILQVQEEQEYVQMKATNCLSLYDDIADFEHIYMELMAENSQVSDSHREGGIALEDHQTPSAEGNPSPTHLSSVSLYDDVRYRDSVVTVND